MKHSYIVCPSCHAINRVDAEKILTMKPKCGQCGNLIATKAGISDINLDDAQRLSRAADVPVVVDLWASWCGPCVSFAPTFEKVARQRAGDFVFAKINTEQYPDAMSVLGVRGIPTLIAFKGGDELKRQSGAMPEAMFVQWLNSL